MNQVIADAEHRGMMAAIGFSFRLLDGIGEQAEALVKGAENLESAGIAFAPQVLRDYLHNENAQTQVAIAREVLRHLHAMRKLIAKLPKEPE